MKNITKFLLGLVIIIIIFGAVKLNISTANSHIIKIGVMMPLSGDLAVFGENVKKGIDMASKNFPENKFEIIYEDTKGLTNSSAVSTYQKLVSIDNIDVILGPFGPEQMLAIAPMTEEKNIPVFGVSLCDERLKKYSTLFCNYPSFDEQIKSAMPEIKELGLKRLLLVTENEELGDIMSKTIKKYAPLGGYEVIGEERGKRGDKDFRSMIAKVKSQNPDIVYSALDPTDGHIFLKQLHELKFTGTNFAQLDTTEEKLKSFVGNNETIYLPGHISENFEKGFVEEYLKKNKDKPDMYIALGHSTALLVLDTLNKNNWNVKKLKEDIVEEVDFKTAITGFQFNKDHTVSIPLEMLLFKGGKIGRTE